MNQKLLCFTQRYRNSLGIHLDDGHPASLDLAHGLGAMSLGAGMDAVQLARLHGRTVARQLGPDCQARRRPAIIKRGRAFFLAAIGRSPEKRGPGLLSREAVTGLLGGLLGSASRQGGIILRLRAKVLRYKNLGSAPAPLIPDSGSITRCTPETSLPRTNTPDLLTRREVEVLTLIAGGKSNKEVAAHLGISLKTVEKHREHVMKKLDIHETAGLTRYAMAQGLVS